jgi:hypothetical protein
MIFFKAFDKVGKILIRRLSLSPHGSLIYATGTIFENFQALGKVLEEIDLLKICAIGGKISGKKSLMNFRGIPSSPTAFDFTDRIAFFTSKNETVRNTN